MNSFKIDEDRPSEHIRKIALAFDGEFEEGLGASSLKLDNSEIGHGYINLYEPISGMNVRTYNLKLTKELSFNLKDHGYSPLYFIYCLEGSYNHHYSSTEKATKIAQGRNLISISAANEEHELTLPANEEIKISVIALLRNKLKDEGRGNLVNVIRDIVIKMDQGKSYQFIGGLRNNIERHAKILIENRRTDLAGKLITEAAAYTTLAAQLDDHDKDLSNSTNIELTDKELDRVIALCNYISNNLDKSNTIKELAYTSGLYPKKLQDAFQYLFNESVAAFIKNMRLEKSKELLENTNLSVGLICDKIGINSKSYFSKIFTEKYGNLPTDYRLSFNQGENSFELSYRSKARLYLPDTEVEKIVTLSEQSNKDVGITGCLIYYEEEFFQIIEGKKSDVLNLFEKIKEDERHKKVTILWKGYRKKKIFNEPGLFFVSDRKNFNYNHIKDLGINMQSLLRGDKKTAIKDLRFWQRIRNLIIDKALVG